MVKKPLLNGTASTSV